MREVSYLVTTAWLCYVMNPFSFMITLEENKNGESQNMTILISPLGQSIQTGTSLTIMLVDFAFSLLSFLKPVLAHS